MIMAEKNSRKIKIQKGSTNSKKINLFKVVISTSLSAEANS